jgi:ribosomal protein L7/L12
MQNGKLVTSAVDAELALRDQAAETVARLYGHEIDREQTAARNVALLRGVNVTRLPEFVREQARNGENYIRTIKAVREQTGWGLKDTKDFCDVIRAGVGVHPYNASN